MRTRTAFLVPLSLLVASNAIVTSCAPSDSDSYRSRSAQSSVVSRSIEEQLAVIDAGGNIAADDPRVARFRTVLSSLAAKYPETRQQISDMSVKARQMLQQAGPRNSLSTLWKVLTALRDAIRADNGTQSMLPPTLLSEMRGGSHISKPCRPYASSSVRWPTISAA